VTSNAGQKSFPNETENESGAFIYFQKRRKRHRGKIGIADDRDAESQDRQLSPGLAAKSPIRSAFIPCYSEFVVNEQDHVDKPEPRWQAVLAFLAVGAIYLALPRSLILGPIWLQLLLSGALLWLTNVIVFALWYWRLDGGGPTLRHEHKRFGSCSFLFPQMQIQRDERGQFACAHWRPRFVDYLFVAFTQSSTFGPTDAPLLARWAKILAMIQIFISLSIVILLISRAVGVL
jgi:hypothetical protein